MSEQVAISAACAEAAERAMAGLAVGAAQALELARNSPLDELLLVAGRVREAHFANRLHCCAITRVRSGNCSEDCSFCAQSAHHQTGFRAEEPLTEGRARQLARAALEAGAGGFGMVASGCGPAAGDLQRYCDLARAIAAEGVVPHASLGVLGAESAEELARAGVKVYNHNLETSRSFFAEVCTTHDYDQRLATLEAVSAAGMERCCGGIFGLGESWQDRIELGAELAALGIERVPLNFLHPIPGTPLESREVLSAREALRIIAVFRLMLPRSLIQVCGGRELVLGSLQPLAFAAGATGVILGNYLATGGQSVDMDLAMFRDLGLELVS